VERPLERDDRVAEVPRAKRGDTLAVLFAGLFDLRAVGEDELGDLAGAALIALV
jgi:hypothetical protein